MALLHLARSWAERSRRGIRAVTVDHNLREDSAAEAQFVSDACKAAAIPHDILVWNRQDSSGNLQDAARSARRSLIGDWARRQRVSAVLLGHTRDDQAETFLMRLARGSGVDGLAAMYAVENGDGHDWVRPLLRVSRSSLRQHLDGLGIAWCEDPGNEDMRFARVRMRAARPQLEDLGLDARTLADTAGRMKVARAGLEAATLDLARRIAVPTAAGSVRILADGLWEASEEIRLRLVSHALKWVAASRYRPRLDALGRTLAALRDGKQATLAGCLVVPDGSGGAEVCREAGAVSPAPATVGRFDARWSVSVPEPLRQLEIRALGDRGLRLWPGWRAGPHGRNALAATPSLWQKDDLIAAPLAGLPGDCDCVLAEGVESFFGSIVTH